MTKKGLAGAFARTGRLRRIIRRARDWFPLTPLGVLICALGGIAAWQAFGDVDLVLLGVCAIALCTIVLSVSTLVIGVIRVWVALRKLPRTVSAVNAECGYPVRTGFWLPRMWYLPGIRVTWKWLEPACEVRVVLAGERFLFWHTKLEEEISPNGRGWSEELRRRIEISDAFGLCAFAFEHKEVRPVRMMPSTGGLKQMHVVRTLAGGSDHTHPDGTPDGERMDFRQYAPGDPIRFVLWSVFARTRELMVRNPERAMSPSKKTLAYLVTGDNDEPAAGAARVAVDMGALGKDWAFGADGLPEPASTKEAALEALAKSASTPIEDGGRGLAAFIKKAAKDASGRAVVFVPARPGPWLDGLMASTADLPRDAMGRVPVEFVVCTDGVQKKVGDGRFGRLAYRQIKDDDDTTIAYDELNSVLAKLGKMHAKIIVVDRRNGHVSQAQS
jgi:hypothetical protein